MSAVAYHYSNAWRWRSAVGRDGSCLVRNGMMRRVRNVTAWIHSEGPGYVALCPELDVASQGDTVEEARGNLEEAVVVFFETAGEREIEERFQRTETGVRRC